MPLGLLGVDGYDFAVADLPRSRRFYVERMERAGPFFYEIIQREGHEGFGEGNFRALFEAIERETFMDHSSPMG